MNSNTHLDEYLDLQKYLLVFQRRWKVAAAIFTTVVGLSIVAAMSLEKVYQSEAKLLIKVDRTPKLIGFENGAGDIEGLTMESDPLTTEAEIVSSRPIIKQLIQKLDLKNDDGEPFRYEDVVSSLKVKPVTGTDLLDITYNHKDPEFSALVVNTLVDLYIQDHTLNIRSDTSSAKEFIDQQLPQVAARLKQAEANLRDFKNQNRIANLQEETSANIGSLSNVSGRIEQLESQLDSINARYSRLQNQLNMNWQEASAVSALSQSLAVQRVLEQLQEVKVQLARKQNFLSDNAPQVIALKEEQEDLTALLDRQITQTLGNQQQDVVRKINILSLGSLKQEQIAEFANLGLQKEGLEKQLAALEKTYQSYQVKSDSLPRLQEQQRELERRVQAAQSTYQNLLSKSQEAGIAEQQNIGNVRVVAEADVPEEEIAPNKKLIVAGAGVAGALLGIAAAFVLDIRDKTVKNTQEIKQMLPYPLSGVVPDLNRIIGKQQLLLPDSSMSSDIPEFAANSISVLAIREAFHNIQINLGLLDSEVHNKVLVVTSAAMGEGKSTISANLAVAQAQCGKKVLLIDADLRRPSQHRLWGIANDIGLNDVLEKEAVWSDTLHQVMPNLDVMTSGSNTQHPVSLLNSSYMKTLIVGLSGCYDCIIIDTPPFVGMADSKILGKLADGLLFVTRPGVANYGSVVAAKELLADKNLNVLGIVANAVNFDREVYGSNYYYANDKYLGAAN